MRSRRILLLAAALLAACGGDSTGSSGPTAVQAVSGSGQPATVGLLATNPLVVRVTRAGGGGAEGVPVQWAVASGGGSLTAASSVTGADGRAQVQWTLGTRAEPQTVTATVEGLAPVTFSITPAAGPFARVSLSPDSVEFSALDQSATLLATYTDAYGNVRERPGAIAWTSLDEPVAGIQPENGPNQIRVVARADGRARIQVRTGGRADTAIVRVRQQPASIVVTLRNPAVTEGDTTRALAEVRDPGGHLIRNPPLTWSTTDPSGATVDATGKVTALRSDTVDVVATWGTATAAATLYVNGLLRAASVDAGGHHSCALSAAGQAFCWGWNEGGQLGVPASAGGASAVPVVVQTSTRFTAVAASAWPDPQPAAGAGRGHSCGIATDGGLLCWGENGQGQLGREGTTATHVPAPVAGGRTWATVSTGGRHTCGITTGGRTYCWGLDDEGQVGAPTTDTCAAGTGPGGPCARAPEPVAGGLTFTQISTGTAHTCGLTADGAAYCWGRNDSGQLGNGTTSDADAPVAVLGGHTFVSISAGGAHTCARTVSWNGYCWGANGSYQLGNGTTAPATAPVLGNVSSTRLQSGWAHNCFAADDGVVYCWGANGHGQQGGSGPAPAPVAIGIGGLRFTSVSTAGLHTCGVRAADRVALCWGDNDGGKLGAGAGPDRSQPRPVRAP